MCAICLEETIVKDESCMIKGCEHIFHKDCITNLLIHANTSDKKINCPLCRRIFKDVVDLGDEQELQKYNIDKKNGLFKIDDHDQPLQIENDHNEITFDDIGDLESEEGNIYIRYFADQLNETYDYEEITYDNTYGDQPRDQFILSTIPRSETISQSTYYLDQEDEEFEQLFQQFLIEEMENEVFELECLNFF